MKTTPVSLRHHAKRSAIALAVCLSFLVATGASAQLSGTKNIPGDYPTLTDAITDLNAQGVGAGGVTLNVVAGNAQSAPAGGYVVGGAGSLVLTTTTASSPVIIQGNANTVTAPTPQASGVLSDAIFKLVGADWITISGFTMLENAANTATTAGTNNMTEWGVALLYVTTTDGAQNNTIQGNTIDLNRTYANTFGVYSNNSHSPTAVTTVASSTGSAGANSGTKVYGNTITDVNLGIVIVGGSAAAADQNMSVDIGGAAAGSGNTLTNFGTTGTFSGFANVSGTVNGILVRNTTGYNISFNSITSSSGSTGVTSGTLRGIFVPGFSIQPTGTFTNAINNNTLSITSHVVAGAVNGILVDSGTSNATSTTNINNNNFTALGHSVAAASGAITAISQSGSATAGPLVTSISNNTFTNITATTTGSFTFISNSFTTPANGTKNVNGNSIVTAFSKTGAGGTVTLFTDNGSDPTTTFNNSNNNNFSNITLTGATTMAGWGNTNGGTPTKTVTGNTFSNWTAGTSPVTGLTVSFSGTSNVSGNLVSNITAAAAITGITSGSSGTAESFFQNTVHTLTGSGTGAVVGISNTGGATKSFSRNKIYNLENTNAGGTVTGLLISSGTTISVFNNLIGDLRTPSANAANPLVGLGLTGGTTVNASFNTVYLNASSSGALFGSSAVSVSTTPTVTLRNNIFVNTSTTAGAGLAIAHRRASTTLSTYGSASNNNDFFAGTPSASRLIYFDGTNSDQTLAAYKTRVAPRDSSSISENPPFLSTTGSSPAFLHIDPAVPTQLESGGAPVSGITDDFDGETRNASTPDIGADEFAGIPLDLSGPNITYTNLGNTASTGNRTLTVTVSDPSGVASGADSPRIYYRKSTDANYVSNICTMTSGTPQSGTYDCTIDYSLVGGGSVTVNDVIQYFVVAQDTAGNIGSNPGGATGSNVNNVTFSGTPNSYTILPVISGSRTVGAGGDFATVTAAVNALNTAELNGPVTLTLTDPSYTTAAGEAFPIVINANPGSSATNTITIKPAAGVTSSIVGTSATAIIRLNGADFVVIDGSNSGGTDRSLTVTNSSTATSTAAIMINSLGAGAGAVGNTVKNTILACGSDQSVNTNVTYGIAHGGTALGTSGADNDSNSFINNAITKVNIGIFSSGESLANPVLNTVISGNLIGPAAFGADQIGRAGIIFNLTNGAVVTDNEVRFVGVTEPQASGGGSYDKFGISHAFNGWLETATGDLGVSNSLIARNRIHDIVEENTFSAVGIFMAGGNGTAETLNATVNNFIWNVRANGTSGDNGAGIGITSGRGDTVAFNTVYVTGDADPGAAGAASTSSFAVQISSTAVANLNFKDNIVFSELTSNTATLKHGAIRIPAMFAWGTGGSNFNDLYVPAANAQAIVGRVGTIDAPTLMDWQMATGQDANSKSVDPLFVSPTDLHLQATSPLLGMGVSVAGVTTDIDGQQRPATPDIGADEVLVSGTVQLSSATYSVSETGSTVTITATRSGGSDGAVSVAYSTTDGTATATADYTAASGTLTWNDGETGNKTFTVTILDDNVREGDETFTVTLGTPMGGVTIGTQSSATVTIQDNEGPSTYTIDNVSQAEGNSGTTNFVFTVTKVGATNFASTVGYQTADGTATDADNDYEPTSGTLNFAANETSMTITVAVNGDMVVEPNETFTVVLGPVTGGRGVNGGPAVFGTGTIVNDDANVSMNADLSNLTISNGTLMPTFDPATLSYTASVPFSTTSITVTPTAADAGATITVNGVPVASGMSSQAIPLAVGNNTITIVVTAQDGTTMKTYTINVTRAGNVSVNPGGGTFGTLKEAFDAINAGTHTGAVSVSIFADTVETAPAVLNASGTGSASYTSVSITPSGARTVSGAIAAGSPLIDLNGADNVTIDGSGIGGNSLTIANTTVSATAGTSTIRFINGATNNIVRNSTILGSSTGAVAGATGDVLISTSTVAGGNSNNTVTTNNIGPAGANLPTKGVTALGSASPNNNSGNVIDNNHIYDFFSPTSSVAGISLQANNTTITVSNNRIFQTAPRTFTSTSLVYSGIIAAINTGAGTASVTGNVIGFGAADGTGVTTISGSTNAVNGIFFTNASTTVPTSIQNNTVSGINQTTAGDQIVVLHSIFFGNGRYDVGTIAGNKVGSLDGSSAINVTLSAGGAVYGIRDGNSAAIGNTISNNQVGAITISGTGAGTNGFRGILATGGAIPAPGATVTVTNNQVGGPGAGAITSSLVGSYAMYGIQTAVYNGVITDNTIRNISGNSTGANLIVNAGILTGSNSTGPSTIARNVIHSMSNNSGAASNAVRGIQCTLPATANIVEQNFVHSLAMTSSVTTGSVDGIAHGSTGTATYRNNMIRLGVDAAGASQTAGHGFNGLLEQAGTNNIYANSVYIGGSGVTAAANTFAFNSAVVNNTRNYIDNIFWNARSNASGTGKNYAIAVGGTTLNPPGLTSDYNDLYVSGVGGFVGLFNSVDQPTLADWRMATGQDMNSISADPLFVAPNGSAATVDLHLLCGSPAIGAGIAVAGVTNDFDGDPRPTVRPSIGADEPIFNAPTAVSAVSRKVHGSAGTFDINLPLAGPIGIESRSGGLAGDYQIVIMFATPVTVGSASVTSGTGSVATASGNGTNMITVDLTGVTSGQYVTVKLGCTDNGTNLGDVFVTFGVLVGDVNANGSVTSTDVGIVKAEAGMPVTAANFRADIVVNGNINSSDIGQVKAASGTDLPPSAEGFALP